MSLLSQNFGYGNNKYQHDRSLDYSSSNKEFTQALAGQTIVAVEHDGGRAVLQCENGTIVEITANDGCYCGSGAYRIDRVQLVGGVIMSVTSSEEDSDIDKYTYRIFVYTDKVPNGREIVSLSGSDGNGYYGTGYTFDVYRPKTLDQGNS